MAMLYIGLVAMVGCSFDPPSLTADDGLGATPEPAPPPPCASDPQFIVRDGSPNRYFFSATSLLWFAAANFCESNGAYLVTVEDEAEDTYVFEQANVGLLWIGLNDVQSEGNFVWHGGQITDYRNFDPAEPNGGTNENCGEIRQDRQGRWNDAQCNGDPRRFVCECEPTSPGTE